MAEIKLSKGNMSAVINYHGAELKSLIKDGKEYMWQADPAFWNRTSPVLFPFVGAVADGKYISKGKEFKMGQHGFARDMDFELLENDESSCMFILKSDPDTLGKYPYDFELMIGYKLTDNNIEVIWQVNNPSDEDMHFSIGAHPAFNCILDDSAICLKKDGVPLNGFVNSVFGKGLLTDKKADISLKNGIMDLNKNSFDGDAYVIEDSQADEVEILTKDYKHVLSVKFTSPLAGIWSPPTKNAPFLCIEPWYGRADKEGFNGDISEREWNNTLTGKDSFKASYFISI